MLILSKCWWIIKPLNLEMSLVKSTKHGMIGIYSVSCLISLHALIHINTVSVLTDNFRLGVALHPTTLKLDPTYARNMTTPASNTSFYSMQYSQECQRLQWSTGRDHWATSTSGLCCRDIESCLGLWPAFRREL